MAKDVVAKAFRRNTKTGPWSSNPDEVFPPVNTSAPVVSGTARVGSTLSCSTGSWDNEPTSYAYQWLRDGDPISGATSSAYVLIEADEGADISCAVTASNSAGSASQVSNEVGPVEEASTPYGLPLLFSDDFESGSLNKVENGVRWRSSSWTGVSTQNSNGGTRSLRFQFVGTAVGGEATAEQRFSSDTPLIEMAVEFDLYIPDGTEAYGGAAYTIRNNNGSNNNKFMRLWRGNKSDGNDGYSSHYFKTGAESRPSSIASLYATYGKNSGGIGPGGSSGTGPGFNTPSFISSDDLGSWVHIIFYSKCATATEGGVIEVWKNGVLRAAVSGVDIYPSGGSSQNGVDYGYLLGYANSGFSSETLLFIDNVKIYGVSE